MRTGQAVVVWADSSVNCYLASGCVELTLEVVSNFLHSELYVEGMAGTIELLLLVKIAFCKQPMPLQGFLRSIETFVLVTTGISVTGTSFQNL